jgi:hypothetical protein
VINIERNTHLAFNATGSVGLALLAVLTWWLFCHVISERA